MDLRAALRLYLVADPHHCYGNFENAVVKAVSGGVTMVQLRAKHLSDREALALARRLRGICTDAGIPFLVNDRLDIALASHADGVHLGVDDLPPNVVRSLTGDDFIIGFSPDSDDDIRRSAANGVDYLGIGPVFSTQTKGDAGQALGLKEFHRRLILGRLPTVGIGGVNAGNAKAILDAGADGIAVIGAILATTNPAHAAAQLSRNSK